MEDAQPMKKQETSNEKLPSTTQEDLSSDYHIRETLEDLKHISEYDVDQFDEALMAWSEQQHFGQTKFQNEYFVVNSQVSPYRQIRQAMMEIQGRTNALQKTTIQFKRCLNDIARVTAARDKEKDEFHKVDRQYELELLYLDKQIWLNKIHQCKEELNGLFDIIKAKAGTSNPEEITKILEDKELESMEEHKYWIARMGKQSAIDLLTTGRIQAGNLESICRWHQKIKQQLLILL